MIRARGIVVLLLGLLLSLPAAAAFGLTVTGSWSKTIDENDLQSGAGSPIRSQHVSQANEVTLDISGAGGWRIEIRREDTNWDSAMDLAAKRTTSGSGLGEVSGGETPAIEIS